MPFKFHADAVSPNPFVRPGDVTEAKCVDEPISLATTQHSIKSVILMLVSTLIIVEALGFERAREPFHVGIQVRASRRQSNWINVVGFEEATK